MPESRRRLDFIPVLLFLTALVLPAIWLERLNTLLIQASYLIAFVCYLYLWKSPNEKMKWTVGLLARVGFFFTLPVLSDDIFRFLWDGFLLKNGVHPFSELPSYYLDKDIPGLTQELFEKLNSQRYFTIYPPINQALFGVSVIISSNWLVSTGVLRMALLLADIGTALLLKKILIREKRNTHLIFLYLLNPLIIIEGVGNVHFEIFVIVFLIASLYFVSINKWKAGTTLGLAMGTKLLPLIVLPFVFFRDLRSKSLNWTISAILIALISLIPLYNESFINGMQSSLSLYVRNFEFNGSLFAIGREIGILITGYNPIKTLGPIYVVVTFLFIVTFSFIASRRDYEISKTWLFVWVLYLLLAMTIHPWYVLPLIPLGLLSGYIFPVVWSLTIFITYAGYSEHGYDLHWVWIVLEYLLVVLAFIYNNQLKRWLTIS
ncbi:MAG: hypothetical protein ACO2ZZ_14270 [Cyclobacteriaceae bacterium]